MWKYVKMVEIFKHGTWNWGSLSWATGNTSPLDFWDTHLKPSFRVSSVEVSFVQKIWTQHRLEHEHGFDLMRLLGLFLPEGFTWDDSYGSFTLLRSPFIACIENWHETLFNHSWSSETRTQKHTHTKRETICIWTSLFYVIRSIDVYTIKPMLELESFQFVELAWETSLRPTCT